MQPFTFHSPQNLIFGGGTRFQLPEQLRALAVKRVLIVTDDCMRRSGVIDAFTDRLTGESIGCSVFSDVQPDPTDSNVLAGLLRFREAGADAIVAVGGGSCIDAAKIIGAAAVNAGPLHMLQGYNKVSAAGPPLVAIPTTAGTGSEVSKVAVITDTARQVKMMILDPKIMPRVAIVDYELTLTMPPQLTAHVGVDTLTHGIEAYVSGKANELTDSLALSCIRLTASHLPAAWAEPDNRAAREGMALAACQGGMAFTNSSVCLVHGMSRPLGALFHLPHGLANAALLPVVTRYSIPGAVQRYAHVARTMRVPDGSGSDEAACQSLVARLEELNRQLGIQRLRDCTQTSEHHFKTCLERMAEDALASGSPQNNPVLPAAGQIAALYREAW